MTMLLNPKWSEVDPFLSECVRLYTKAMGSFIEKRFRFSTNPFLGDAEGDAELLKWLGVSEHTRGAPLPWHESLTKKPRP